MHNKHGVTLVEMCIVLALIMIVSTMVASFCIMTSNYTAVAAADRDVVEGVALLEDALSKWLSAFDSTDYIIIVSADGKSLTANAGRNESGTQYFLKIENGKISGSLPGDRSVNYSVPAIELEKFEIVKCNQEQEQENNWIISCKIYYTRKKIASETSVPMTILRYLRVATIQEATADENP